jgi:hypothetical protein
MPVSHEFIVTRDLYNEIETEPNVFEVKLIKKNVKTKWFCKNLDMISSCEQHYNENGNIRREYSKIIADGEERIVNMRYKDIKQLISPTTKGVGYK